MQQEQLEKLRQELDTAESARTLLSELSRLREENDRLRLKQRYFYKFINQMKQQVSLITYVSNSHNENLSRKAGILLTKYKELMKEYSTEIHGTNEEPQESA